MQGMYRGKRIDGKGWVKGWYVKGGSDHISYIIEESVTIHHLQQNNFQRPIVGLIPVIPESVGQSTGRKDRNGVEIYGGDITKLSYGIPPTYDTLIIEYADDETVGIISVSGWWMRNVRKNGVSGSLCKAYENDLEIIGNTTDNPKLLKEQE